MSFRRWSPWSSALLFFLLAGAVGEDLVGPLLSKVESGLNSQYLRLGSFLIAVIKFAIIVAAVYFGIVKCLASSSSAPSEDRKVTPPPPPVV